MKHLLIIGARGYGRGVYDIARSMKTYQKEFDIKGFLDDKQDALAEYDNYPPIMGAVETYVIQPNDVFICALGDVKWKKHYVSIILEKGGEFMNVIHPSAHIGGNVRIGTGCVVGYMSQIDCDVTIGNFVNIQTNVVVGHDTNVGSWSILDCFSFTGGFSYVGESVTLHTRSTVLPKLTVGKNAIVNAGSVVIRNVKENTIVMGNPAKEMIIPKLP